VHLAVVGFNPGYKELLMRIVRNLLAALLALIVQAENHVGAQDKPVVLASFDYPPFMETVDGQPSGIMVDVVTEAFRRMGTPVKITLYPLGRNFMMVDTGEVDGMFTVKKTPERIAAYLFSKEVMLTQEYVIFVTRDSKLTFDGRLGELGGQLIGVVRDTSYGSVFDTAVRDGALKQLDFALTHESNFRKLLLHHVDAVVSSKIVGLSILKRLNANGQVKIIGPALETTQSYVMFGKKVSPVVVQSFDRSVASMQSDGTFSRIFDKYTK